MGQVFTVLAKGGINFSQAGQTSGIESTFQSSSSTPDLDTSKISNSETSQKVLLVELESLEEEIEEDWGNGKFEKQENHLAGFFKTLIWSDLSISKVKILHFCKANYLPSGPKIHLVNQVFLI